jgi:hypothetical protein
MNREQRPRGASGARRLPEGSTTAQTQRSQGTDLGQDLELLALQSAAAGEIVGIDEGRPGLLPLDGFAGPFAQTLDETQTQPRRSPDVWSRGLRGLPNIHLASPG